MKKSVIITLLLAVSSVASVFSQSKIGYIEYDYVLALMPQMEEVAKKMDNYTKQAEQMQQEQEAQLKKLQDLAQDPNTLPVVKKNAENQLQQRFQEYQYNMRLAQYQLDSLKQVELRKVADELDLVIAEVAEEKGLDYVLTKSTSTGYNIVYVKNQSDDISKAVMRKLGIKEPQTNGLNPNGTLNNTGGGVLQNPIGGGY